MDSPLLRLPCEILISILLFTVDDTIRTPAWTIILPTCHYLYQTILFTPQLWGKISCTHPEKMFKRFEMAQWCPTEVYAHLFVWNGEDRIKAALDSVRDAGKLRRDMIHTLEFRGETEMWSHFSWIFDEPLPSLRHLTVSVVMRSGHPIPFTASIGKHLETLSIDNLSIPVSSHLSHNLRNLHVGFSKDCHSWSMTMHQLIAILNASPRLETLSLERTCPNTSSRSDNQSKPVATLSNLKSLALTGSVPEAVSILDHLNLPSITSLTLDLSDMQPSHFRLFSKDTLANSLFNITPIFPHFTQSGMIKMGGLKLVRLATDDWRETFLLMSRMVPLSVTELEIIQDTLDKSHWREFACQRPEVYSIPTYHMRSCRSSRLWRALLPDEDDPSATLFPKLKSVTLKVEHLSMIPRLVLDCLRMRSEAGFRLRRLEVQDSGKLRHVGRQAEDFRPLVDELVHCVEPTGLWR